jgi:hypothetical protein
VNIGRSIDLVLGVLATSIAVLASSSVVGPLIRRVIMTPRDFGSDYSSGSAIAQALVVHALCLSMTFGLLGARIGLSRMTRSWHQMIWSANPITILLGCLLAIRALPADLPTEYVGNAAVALVSVLGPLVAVPAAILGQRLRDPS